MTGCRSVPSGRPSVQIARKLGASVAVSTATTTARAEQARTAGYEHIVDLSSESLRDGVMRMTGGKGVDVVIDGVGGSLTGEALGCLAPGGTYAVVGYAAGKEAHINLTDVIWNGIVTLSSSGSCGHDRGEFRKIMLAVGRKYLAARYQMPRSGSLDRRLRKVGADVDENGHR